MTLQRFLIERSVESASGSQVFFIDAHSEAEAISKHKAGEGDIYADECEVGSLGEPWISGTTSLDDFGDNSGSDKHGHFDALVDLLRDISGTLQFADPMKERILETLAKVTT